MGKKKHSNNTVQYRPAKKKYWTGRSSDPKLGAQYWHQAIQLSHIEILEKKELKNYDIALLGYACDEGVRRNFGRVGARKGPKKLRERLAKLPIHFESKSVVDMGDVICKGTAMESCQKMFSIVISNLIEQHIFPIAIGGGHDMAYAHFIGIWNAIKTTPKKKIGILNFDAHFDLRPMNSQGNSGTPFNQILSEFKNSGGQIDYFAIGIQQQSNTKELFQIAKREKVHYTPHHECTATDIAIDNLQKKLAPFIAKNDHLYISIDLDGFSSAYAMGVSAPSPLGFTPYFLFKMLHFLLKTKKVISCDIAELNPDLDQDNLTANLAAKIVDFVVTNH